MKASKLGSMIAVLGLAGSMVVACGDDDGGDGPLGGAGGSAEAGSSGDPVGGSGEAGGGSGAGSNGGAGGTGETAGNAGEAGNGGAGAPPTCAHSGKTYEVGESYAESMDLCTCEATGEFTCVGGCSPTEAEILDLFDQVKACDPEDADSCTIEITYDNLYHPECTWSVTRAGAQTAQQLTSKLELLNALDCDADTITKLPCPATRSTTCLPSGICADFAE